MAPEHKDYQESLNRLLNEVAERAAVRAVQLYTEQNPPLWNRRTTQKYLGVGQNGLDSLIEQGIVTPISFPGGKYEHLRFDSTQIIKNASKIIKNANKKNG